MNSSPVLFLSDDPFRISFEKLISYLTRRVPRPPFITVLDGRTLGVVEFFLPRLLFQKRSIERRKTEIGLRRSSVRRMSGAIYYAAEISQRTLLP